jgi:hypothetical protein
MSNSLLTKNSLVLPIKKEISKMPYGFTNQNKIIARNLFAQQYTAKLMLEICNVRDLAFVLLRSTSVFICLFSFGRDGSV